MTTKKTKTVYDILSHIQQKLKAPKNQYNNFGKYSYRSQEDILEAVKPLLEDGRLVISDELLNIGDRYYIKATVKLSYGGEDVSVSAFAREALEQKGMNEAQITGSASSYARKYALNGLFLIDDTKDADTRDNTKIKVSSKKKIDTDYLTQIGTVYNAFDEEKQAKFQMYAKSKYKKSVAQLTTAQQKELLKLMKTESFDAIMDAELKK